MLLYFDLVAWIFLRTVWRRNIREGIDVHHYKVYFTHGTFVIFSVTCSIGNGKWRQWWTIRVCHHFISCVQAWDAVLRWTVWMKLPIAVTWSALKQSSSLYQHYILICHDRTVAVSDTDKEVEVKGENERWKPVWFKVCVMQCMIKGVGARTDTRGLNYFFISVWECQFKNPYLYLQKSCLWGAERVLHWGTSPWHSSEPQHQ